MFTEDYLMRIINQAVAALAVAAGLRKAGKNSDARQVVRQAVGQLTNLPVEMIDLMDDASLLNLLTSNDRLDAGRLRILADLYREQGETFYASGQPAQGGMYFASALRFVVEAVLADEAGASAEDVGSVDALLGQLETQSLPVDTQMALGDHYQRLLDLDDSSLAAAGTSRATVQAALARLQEAGAS